jgi:hypothetical protein
METVWRTALWLQYGAAIDVFEQALVACPDSLWRERLWQVPADDSVPPAFAEFWYLSYHTLFWLDLYLTGAPEEDFAPPAPFVWTEVDPVWVVPEQPYTKEELHGYLKTLREKCRATLLTLTDERARQPCAYGWGEGKPVSYLELQLYTMRHVQEHAAQLSLLLGQHGIPGEALTSVARAKDEPDSH